jgi:uncharacterized membrane protein/mono/diheme cytochrome c family protein
VLVHLPIGLLLLVPVLEIGGLLHTWRHLQKTAGFVLILATIGSVFATVVGWLLAWSGGYEGETVMDHLWGGVGLSAACIVLTWFRRGYTAGEGYLFIRLGYMPLLFATIGLMSWTSHQGSVITHGDDYLTKHMPVGLKKFLGLNGAVPPAKPAAEPKAGVAAEPAPAAPSFYVAKIVPIFEKHCVACHKPSKIKGGLRMDTYELLMEGGDSGPPVIAGSLEKSDLYRRITLPTDDEEFMPTDGKPALKPEEIKLIAEWIMAGAKP